MFQYSMVNQTLNQLSEKLLLAVKMEESTTALKDKLNGINLNSLKNDLTSDDQKKAFWINIYNAFYLILRKEEKLVKPEIYKNKRISIAGENFSLDDVEHGVLRKYRYKYSLGFLPNLLAPKLIKELAVGQLDYRIHFALNCGAKSCPPIAFYKDKNIDSQLNMATQTFLESESEFDDKKNVVYTTALFQWFLGDFGGKRGIKKIFKQQLNKDISAYQIKFKDYSWEEDLDNFVSGDS